MLKRRARTIKRTLTVVAAVCVLLVLSALGGCASNQIETVPMTDEQIRQMVTHYHGLNWRT